MTWLLVAVALWLAVNLALVAAVVCLRWRTGRDEEDDERDGARS